MHVSTSLLIQNDAHTIALENRPCCSVDWRICLIFLRYSSTLVTKFGMSLAPLWIRCRTWEIQTVPTWIFLAWAIGLLNLVRLGLAVPGHLGYVIGRPMPGLDSPGL